MTLNEAVEWFNNNSLFKYKGRTLCYWYGMFDDKQMIEDDEIEVEDGKLWYS